MEVGCVAKTSIDANRNVVVGSLRERIFEGVQIFAVQSYYRCH